MKETDIDALAQAGALPADPFTQAKPLTPKAKQVTEDEARLKTVRQIIKEAADGALSARDTKRILTTTHWEMDRDTGGFVDEQVWFFGGISGFGKTSWTIACADEQLKAGRRPLIISAEDPPRLYGERLLMRRTRVDRYRFAEGKLHRAEMAEIVEAANRAENLPVYVNAVGRSVEWVAKEVRKVIQLEGIDITYWDYVQAFSKEKATEQRRMELTYIARTIIDVIKMSGKSGCVCSQITPDDKHPVPKKEMLRDSKDMGNMAEVVAIGFFARNNIERGQDGQRALVANEGERCIVIDKNKPGPGPASGRIYRCGSDVQHGCFDVVTDPDDQFRTDYSLGDLSEPLDWKD